MPYPEPSLTCVARNFRMGVWRGSMNSDHDMPTHYAFKTGNSLDSLEEAYERALALSAAELGPKPYARPAVTSRASARLVSRVRHAIDGLDDRGRWLEQGRLRDHGADSPTEPVINCRTFIANCRLLSRYLASEPAH